ncbi:phenylacetic acid degradation protein PaaY [Herbaspirillum sp. HC18]|nr:phenylacetic acid degradation protein PaaY [Herbaspirillum sp. HC18]
MPIYSFDGLIPVVHPSAYVHPTAILIGDVMIGPRCYVGPGASLRGDAGQIVMEEGSNVQDNCIAHSFPGAEMVIEANGHIGHGAVLHGCRVKRNALVGINAVVMDSAVIGEASIVAAMTFVKAGMVIEPRHLVAGVPGKVIRPLTDMETEWKAKGTAFYHHLVDMSLRTMQEATPLAEAEPGRKRLVMPAIDPLHIARLSA